MRDTARKLDHTFNFGFFDFEQENFFLRFLQGRMLYFSAAQPVRKEFAQYQAENRSIRLQRLNLDSQQKERLIDYLVDEVSPDNREYLYHYYRNNCSTRIRDAIDLALGGSLEEETRDLPATGNWRDHTRRLTAGDFWLYLGLEVGLGSPVDRDISIWDEMFIPAELADAIAQAGSVGGSRLVIEDSLLLDRFAEQALAEIARADRSGRLLLDAAALAATPAPLARRVARLALARAGADGRRVAARHVEVAELHEDAVPRGDRHDHRAGRGRLLFRRRRRRGR